MAHPNWAVKATGQDKRTRWCVLRSRCGHIREVFDYLEGAVRLCFRQELTRACHAAFLVLKDLQANKDVSRCVLLFSLCPPRVTEHIICWSRLLSCINVSTSELYSCITSLTTLCTLNLLSCSEFPRPYIRAGHDWFQDYTVQNPSGFARS